MRCEVSYSVPAEVYIEKRDEDIIHIGHSHSPVPPKSSKHHSSILSYKQYLLHCIKTLSKAAENQPLTLDQHEVVVFHIEQDKILLEQLPYHQARL